MPTHSGNDLISQSCDSSPMRTILQTVKLGKCDLSDFGYGMIVSFRQTGLSMP